MSTHCNQRKAWWDLFDTADTMDSIERINWHGIYAVWETDLVLLKIVTDEYICGYLPPHYPVPSTIVHGQSNIRDAWYCLIDDKFWLELNNELAKLASLPH